jgi:protease IV
MSSEQPGLLRRLFGWLWAAINFARRLVVNLLFIAIVVVIVVAWLVESHPTVADDTALVLSINGRIVEQYTGGASEVALSEVLGDRRRETQLRDLLDVIDAAADDPKITSVLLLLDDMDGAGLATLHEVAAALGRLREAGKPVIAWGSSFDQRQYFLAAHADEVYLHPFGSVLLRGMGGYRNYYREVLDKLGVTVNVFRVGQFKSFAEPFTSNGPSKEALEDEARWMNDAWTQFTDEVEQARHLDAGSIQQLIEGLTQRLKAADGDAAKLAVDAKLVDGLKTPDEMRSLMRSRAASAPTDQGGFRQVSLANYLASLTAPAGHGNAVGVVVAEGDIVDGDAPQGVIGGRTVSDLIRRAREDGRIKALVMRVDSPGGMTFASEMIRHELEVTRAAGKPVVVSMGDAAASGGYWVATAADEIVANPGTITGSIGVFALLPNADKAFDKLGIHTGGVTTTWLAGAGDPRRPLDKRVGELLQTSIDNTYRRFVSLVAQSRKLTTEQVDAIAQGRVWTGRQARDRGLVDTLGGLEDAITRAADRAKLGEDYEVLYLEREQRGFERIVSMLMGELGARVRGEVGRQMGSFARVAGLIGREGPPEFGWLTKGDWNPFAGVSHCLCRVW